MEQKEALLIIASLEALVDRFDELLSIMRERESREGEPAPKADFPPPADCYTPQRHQQI